MNNQQIIKMNGADVINVMQGRMLALMGNLGNVRSGIEAERAVYSQRNRLKIVRDICSMCIAGTTNTADIAIALEDRGLIGEDHASTIGETRRAFSDGEVASLVHLMAYAGAILACGIETAGRNSVFKLPIDLDLRGEIVDQNQTELLLPEVQ